jgi:hypothetical protein
VNGARLLLLVLLGSCAAPPYDYRAYLAHMPRSILVLPPVNDSMEVHASNAFLATVTLAERGYYVFPVAVVDAWLRQNGRPTPADMHAVEPGRLREVFGADAALYIHIKDWGTSYQVLTSRSRVVTECRLVDLRTGTTLWTGNGAAVSSSGDAGGGIVGALASAVVSQVASSISDPCPELACQANENLFGHDRVGLLLGHRHPGYEEDQVRRRAAAAPQ